MQLGGHGPLLCAIPPLQSPSKGVAVACMYGVMQPAGLLPTNSNSLCFYFLDQAVRFHAAVCDLQTQDPRLLGPNNKHLPQLVSAFVEVLGRGSELINEGIGRRMAGLLHSMQGSIPAGLVEATFSGLSDKQKANFQAYMAGQMPA
eukprot:GHRR01019105.1.p1 GENE.GHRR01019105.1~~GHRR01019105.1.p1  ORF type:complete len:146 (-),score=33.10 GHRR01019105.1:468-905(-)